jgi:hypothetical protein
VLVMAALIVGTFTLSAEGASFLDVLTGNDCAARHESAGTEHEEISPNPLVAPQTTTGRPKGQRGQSLTEQPNHDAGEEPYETCRLAVHTRNLAIFTAFLFAATAALVAVGIWHARHVRDSVKAAEKLAISSQKNVDLIPEIERAYVSGGGVRQISQSAHLVVNGTPVPPIPPDSVITMGPNNTLIRIFATGRFDIHINNHGKTPSHVYRIQYGFCNANNVPTIPYFRITRKWFDTFGPGDQSRFVVSVPIFSQWPRAAIFGRFYHRDIWGNRRSVGFIYGIPGPGLTPNNSIPIEAPRAYTQERDEPDDREDT